MLIFLFIDTYSTSLFVRATEFVFVSHQHRHTVDLVLGYGLSLSINQICVLPILHHSFTLFDILILNLLKSGKMSTNIRSSRYIGPKEVHELNQALPDIVDSVTENFNYAPLDLLDLVAPAKTQKCFQKSPMPWINDALLLLRKNYRKFERQ